MAFINEDHGDGEGRTIDPVTGAYLVYEGGTPEPGYHRFSFHWKNETIPFYVEKELINNGKELPSVKWKYSWLEIPPSLKPLKQDLIRMVGEALAAHGSFYSFKTVKDSSSEYHVSPREAENG